MHTLNCSTEWLLTGSEMLEILGNIGPELHDRNSEPH
jgi:hypothetical protein